jgi:hypothetical protein
MQRSVLFLVVMVLLVGCASVEVQRGKDLATAGVQYATATASLVDVAIDSMIDADSEALVRSKLPSAALRNPAFTPDKLRERLAKSNEGLVQNAKLYLSLRASLVTVQDYFKALQTLADNPQSETTSSAVSNIADRINVINKVVKDGSAADKPLISDAQKDALSGLAKLVADQVHGAMLGAELKRDAPIIGEALLLQEKLLENAETVILAALKDENARFYIDKVQRPFEKQEIGDAWITDRKAYLKAKAIGEISEALKTARAASKQMSKTWEKILSGVYDASEMRQQIAEVEALVAATAALKQAGRSRASNQ